MTYTPDELKEKSDRLRDVMDALELGTQAAFADSIGLKASAMSLILNGRNWLSKAKLRELEKKHKVNLHWLETGVGTMFTDGSLQAQAQQPVRASLNKPHLPQGNVVTVTVDTRGDEVAVYVPVQAHAGYLQHYNNPHFLAELPHVKLSFIKLPGLRLFEAKGDSMEPTLYDRDILFCTQIFDLNEIEQNHVYVVVSKDEGIVVKRVLYNKKEERLTLRSDNEFYAPFKLKAQEVTELWKVRRKLSAQLPSPSKLEVRVAELEVKIHEMDRKLGKE